MVQVSTTNISAIFCLYFLFRTDGKQNVLDNLETIKSSPIFDDMIATVKLQLGHAFPGKSVTGCRASNVAGDQTFENQG